jgi:hypothetical protein
MLKRSEDMAPVRSRRVHGDLKKKILLSAYEVEHQPSGRQVQRLEVKTRRCCCYDNPTQDNSVLSPKPLHLVIKR